MRASISYTIWRALIKQLRLRGQGRRESGAFLLGKVGQDKITTFILYDDLDPHCLDEGIVVFDGQGFMALWKICETRKLCVIADVHTHSGTWTGQSDLDKRNPMIGTKGHLALILPNYAKNHFMNLQGIGIYEYLGAHKWRTLGVLSRRIKWTAM